jgi:two-component system CheB/CheR fusion protein
MRARAVCVVLSGTGTDGSVGLRAVKQQGGFVIAQEPSEAEYDGMPLSAIATGVVDVVLPVARIPEAIHRHSSQPASATAPASPPSDGPSPAAPPPLGDAGAADDELAPDAARSTDRLPDIIELLRSRAAHDFSLYKPGTLKRRVERRMAMASLGSSDMERYVEMLKSDPAEVERLAKDLLIHVTGFFRDPAVFEALETSIVPGMISSLRMQNTLRIWVAGCSTGKEAYSLAMIVMEQIAAANSSIKLQVFASDADPGAVAFARDGLYPSRSGRISERPEPRASLPRRTTATGCSRSFGRAWCLRSRTC